MQKSITHRKVRPTQDRFSNVVEHDTSQIDFGSLLRLISVQSLSPEKGDHVMNIPAGTAFEDLPENWTCPICGVRKDNFRVQD